MILTELRIHHVRNITFAQCNLNPQFNFITGANGSGKTSLLEALYLLSCGRSFRTHETSPLITKGENTLNVFARASDESSISIQKSLTGGMQIKLNQEYCSTTSQLAYALPCQIVYSDLFQIMDAGPSVRRGVLDWGLFHVKHAYLAVWKNYKRALKQRNALLRARAPYAQCIPWDNQLNTFAMQLDALRQDYVKDWVQHFNCILNQLTSEECTLTYYKGWDKKNSGADLFSILAAQHTSDLQKQYTQSGPHQADIVIESNHSKAKQILSRGQQKIILIAMKLAQADLLSGDCLFLFDDLSAELDELHQTKLFTHLSQRKGQYVITSLQNLEPKAELLQNATISRFIMDSGVLTQ
jgi:DNA replication and repair protein RecF